MTPLLGIVGIAAIAIACGGSPAPRSPADDVRAEIAAAEQSERARRHHVARAHYERAVSGARDPASVAYARHRYAETLAHWGELDAAIAQLERVIEVADGDASAWHDLGLLRHKRGHDRAAIVALERARELVPRDIRPRIALAALRWKLGDRGGATTEYRGLLELDLPARLRDKVEWALAELAKR
jgi:Flp pilus assembly protein TadD